VTNVRFSNPWTDPATGTSYAVNDVASLDDGTAEMLVAFGTAVDTLAAPTVVPRYTDADILTKAPIDAEWQPTTAYVAGQLVTQDTDIYKVTVPFTSGTDFDATNLTKIGSGVTTDLLVAQLMIAHSSDNANPVTPFPLIRGGGPVVASVAMPITVPDLPTGFMQGRVILPAGAVGTFTVTFAELTVSNAASTQQMTLQSSVDQVLVAGSNNLSKDAGDTPFDVIGTDLTVGVATRLQINTTAGGKYAAIATVTVDWT
jgi:hypothetical protein